MNKKLVAIGVPVILVVLLGVAVWWLFNSGRLVYVASGTKAPEGLVVCGSDVVTKYNEASLFIKRQGADAPSVDKESLKTIASDIRNKKGYEGDPTCQTLLFWSAVRNDDYKAAKEAAGAVKQLHEKRLFADSNIRNNDAVFNYQTSLNMLTGAETVKEETWSDE